MKALSMILVFGGYVLIYAAVAKQGKFATEPWAGLFADAYTDDTAAAEGAATPATPAAATPTATGAAAEGPAIGSVIRPRVINVNVPAAEGPAVGR